MRRSSRHRKNRSQLTLVQRGAAAMLQANLPDAFRAFAMAYHAPTWRGRDAAVTGLCDLLDIRITAEGKKPALLTLLQWEPTRYAPPKLNPSRLLALQEGFLLTSTPDIRNLTEKRTTRALFQSKGLLERILINDPHYLVRFSALLVLTTIFQDERDVYIQSALQRASRRESNPPLKEAIEKSLH